MGQAWAALLGAVVGGFFTLAGALAVELRRDRRRKLGAARLVLGELERSRLELEVKMLEEEPDVHGWHVGPHRGIRTEAWRQHAVEFVSGLDKAKFDQVDEVMKDLTIAGDIGFNADEPESRINKVRQVEQILEPLTRPTWFDRHIWRL